MGFGCILALFEHKMRRMSWACGAWKWNYLRFRAITTPMITTITATAATTTVVVFILCASFHTGDLSC